MFAQESVMDFQKEKEAFEAWFESRYDAHFMQFALDLDFYVDKHTQTCWEAWQAKAQAVPEGFVLVPKEPTDIEIESIKEKHWDMRGCQLCKSDYIDLYKAMIGAQEQVG